MTIGARSPLWRRTFLRALAGIYVRRRGVTPDGKFDAYVSGGSSLKLFASRGLCVDPVHRAFIRDWVTRDATVWDVGANLGLFAFPAALKARQVYAFEPDVDVVQQLQRSASLPENKRLNVSVMPFAVSEKDGTAEFEISAYSTAMSRLKREAPWHDQVTVRETRYVATLTIDTLAKNLSPPTVIKLDVEGAEVKVLEGAQKTIARHRPVMLIEGPRELWDALGSFLKDYEYVILDGAGDARQPLEHPVWDTVAVPRDKFELKFATSEAVLSD